MLKIKCFISNTLVSVWKALSSPLLKLTVACVACLQLVSCSDKDEASPSTLGGELMWVQGGISEMPVFVSGNTNSNIIILIIHGGPGATSMEYVSLFEKKLGKDFMFAAWDQRYSGYSKFDDSQVTPMTIASNIEDCNAVINTLKTRYPDKKIVIWGQSWGGAIVSGYATHPTYNNKIAGWIVANGAISGFEFLRSGWEFAVRRCNEKIQEGELHYQDTLIWLNNNQLMERAPFDRPKLLEIIRVASSLYYEGEPETPADVVDGMFLRMKQIFPTQEDAIRYERNAELEVNLIASSEEMYNWSVNVAPMSKPGLLIWGEKDETCTLELLNWYTEQLTNNNKTFTMKLYPNSWHLPFIENQDQHDADVKAFINGL